MSILGKIFCTSFLCLVTQIFFMVLFAKETKSDRAKEILGFFVLLWITICVVTLILMIWL